MNLPNTMKVVKYSIFLLLLYISISCNKENSPSLLLIEPTQIEFTMNSGEIKQFKIYCSSNTNLKSLKITSKNAKSFTQTILDTTLTSDKFVMTYEYQAPSIVEKETILLTFILTDENDNQTEIPKSIIVSPVDIVLKEKTGNIMYSHLSRKFDAFNLEEIEPIYSSQLDLSLVHIKDNSIDSVDHNQLSRKWISMAGLKFIRFNDFDYANASYLSVRKAFEVGIKNPILDNIKEDDIILTKLNRSSIDSGYVAIRIVYVIDSDSTLNDRYIFNVKK